MPPLVVRAAGGDGIGQLRWACRRDEGARGFYDLGFLRRIQIIRKLRASCSRIRRPCCSAWRACGSWRRRPARSWPVAHGAFTARADPLLDEPPGLVAHLRIDGDRRGRPRWRADERTGEYQLLADRWHTCGTHDPAADHDASNGDPARVGGRRTSRVGDVNRLPVMARVTAQSPRISRAMAGSAKTVQGPLAWCRQPGVPAGRQARRPGGGLASHSSGKQPHLSCAPYCRGTILSLELGVDIADVGVDCVHRDR